MTFPARGVGPLTPRRATDSNAPARAVAGRSRRACAPPFSGWRRMRPWLGGIGCSQCVRWSEMWRKADLPAQSHLPGCWTLPHGVPVWSSQSLAAELHRAERKPRHVIVRGGEGLQNAMKVRYCTGILVALCIRATALPG